MPTPTLAGRPKAARLSAVPLEDRCVPALVFQELFNIPSGLPAGWTAVNAVGAAPTWAVDTASAPTPVADPAPPLGITAGNSVRIDDPGTNSDKRLTSPVINIPNVPGTQLRFRQNYNFDFSGTLWDGGILEISVNGGAFQNITAAGGSFVTGGYTGTITTFENNPLGNQPGWGGSTAGWVTSLANLPAAALGKAVQFRWRMGSGDFVSGLGWRVDSVQVATPGNTLAVVSGSGQTTFVTKAYAAPLVVRVLDGFDTPAVGATVTFTAPPAGASVTFPGGTNKAATDAAGLAGIDVVANATAGTFTVSAAAPGGTPVNFTLTNRPNLVPTVSAGGAYVAVVGDPVVFTATASDPEGDPLTFTWDLNGDGVFDDALGAKATLTALQLAALGIGENFSTSAVRVRVSDGFNPPVASAATGLRIDPVPLPPPPPPPGGGGGRPVARLFAAAAGPGGGPHVQVFNADGSPRFNFFAYQSGFRGGITVATGDVTGDGVADVITGAGPGGGPHVKVWDGGTGSEVRSFFAFDPGFRNGISVATGDVNNDGWADVIVGAGPGGGPHVKVFDGRTGGELRSFFAFASGFRGGVSVAGGDVTGDGWAEVIAGAGAGGGPAVRAWDGRTGAVVRDFFAFSPGFTGGVNVAAGDLDGDGVTDLLLGTASGGSTVTVIDGKSGASTVSVDAFPGTTAGARVAINELTGDAVSDAVVATGVGAPSLIRVLAPDGTVRRSFDPFTGFAGGVYIG